MGGDRQAVERKGGSVWGWREGLSTQCELELVGMGMEGGPQHELELVWGGGGGGSA